jgi:hypothetical protein
MIPSIFVSSTVEDLHHLRDGVRDTIAELGYTPVMSEYGDVGYLPRTSAEDACYQSLTDCQLAIVIIGKRYGSLSKTGSSITENEFNTAKENKIPVITLVDQEVMAFKRVFDAHPPEKKPECFPGMEAPSKSFAFVQNVMESSTNNGILPFSNVADARSHFKRQLAHIFGDLLRNQHNTLSTSVKDVLSEIKTLRHEISGGRPPDSRFLMAIRFLVDESNDHFRKLIEHTSGPVDTAVPVIYDAETLEEFIHKVGYTIRIIELPPDDKKGSTFFKDDDHEMNFGSAFPLRFPTSGQDMILGHWGTTRRREVVLTPPTLDYFRHIYSKLRKITEKAEQVPAVQASPH